MRRLQLANQAEQDIDRLLRESRWQFGLQAARRYRALLNQAFSELLVTPAPPSAGPREFAPQTLYFLHLSRVRLQGVDRVGRPRHFIVYEFNDTRVRIVRVLYDAMDLPGQFT